MKAFEISDGGFSSKKSTSPHLTTPSPAASEDAAIARIDLVPVSPNPSETSVKLDAADGDLSSAMEQLVFPEAANGSPTPSDSFSTSNGVHDHQPTGTEAEAAAHGETPICEIGNGEILENGLHENGDCTKQRKDVESPGSSKRETCRYMAATASAKAKFRSSSSPKTKGSSTPEAPEAPAAAAPVKQRNSIGGGAQGIVGKATAQSPSKTPVAFGSGKTTNRRSPSPKTGGPKEKPRSVDVGYDGVSPARRNSLGSGDDKRWRT